jgi:hypothetical protein
MKPNVRARATSFAYEFSAKIHDDLAVSEPNTGCGKVDRESSLKPANGSNRAHLSPSLTSTAAKHPDVALARGLFHDAG